MAFQVQPATYSDLDALANVIVAAHVKDEMVSMMMENVPYEVQVKWYADALKKVWKEDKGARYYKVIEMGSQ
jgi:hypothetical protein